MSLGRTRSVALSGLEGRIVEVEADLASGLPYFAVSGLPDAACAQAPARVRAAVTNSGLPLPGQRILVNLSPASLPKTGARFDLAIAMAVLAASQTVPPEEVANAVHLGELGLDGTVRAVTGVLPAVLAAEAAGIRTVVVPLANGPEAALVDGMTVLAVNDLTEAVQQHRARHRGVPLEPREMPLPGRRSDQSPPDLADVAGQDEARVALEIAAAGGHHLAMIGPPGAGKTMLAERLPGLLPTLNRDAALEATAVHSVLGELDGRLLIDRAPFVAPHHGASMTAIIGGGSGRVQPGAVSRANHGILFLDEAPEFRRDVLDALRQPLEGGLVRIARGDRVVSYPANFQLVLAANPCRCGKRYGSGAGCTCSPVVQRTYLAKLSGPLMDRVDLQLSVFPVTRAALRSEPGESTAVVAERVAAARELQGRRWAGTPWATNSQVPGSILRERNWRLPATETRMLDRALERGSLTLRGYDRCLRVAWTVSDLGGRERPTSDDLLRALALRGAVSEAA
ncbi:YifB family Mg chelatase-like AAA ATPase [Demetria terragena]|uniref:YifB family Mg chelatase-like AAA ATPase n=1 Tax=Demetria terragena TaxID=63959 RepID=UPI00037554A0|nr:YifB family Mg chelatase-like AAA ATPase [Demetria terragena]